MSEHAEQRAEQQAAAADAASSDDSDRVKIDSLFSVDYPIDWNQLIQPSSSGPTTLAAALLRCRIEHRLYEHDADFLNGLLRLHADRDSTTTAKSKKGDDALRKSILHALLRAGHLRLLLNDVLKALKAYERFYAFARQFIGSKSTAEYLEQPNLLRNFFYGIAICYDELNLVYLARDAYNLALQKQQVQQQQPDQHVADASEAAPKFNAKTSSAFIQTIHYRLALLYQDAGLEKLSRKHLLWLRQLVVAASVSPSAIAEPAAGSKAPVEGSTLSTTSAAVLRIDFQLAKLYEKSGKIEHAKKLYEEILQKSSTLSSTLSIFRSSVYKQLGWLAFMHVEFGDTQLQRAQVALNCLKQSIELNEEDGQTWYFIGRCYSALGHVRDAYAAYKNSIDKSDANADTWCSIGILYQQQKQQVDALQAYACAIQLDESHHFAWLNLGMLYESVAQYRDALHCFKRCCAETNNNSSLPEQIGNLKVGAEVNNSSTPVGTPQQPSNNSESSTTVSADLLRWCRQRITIFEQLVQLQEKQQQNAADPQPPHAILAHVNEALTSHLPFAEMFTSQSDGTKRRRALLEPDGVRPIPDELSAERNWPLLSAYNKAATASSSRQSVVLNEEQILQAQGVSELHELRQAVQTAIQKRDEIASRVEQLQSRLDKKNKGMLSSDPLSQPMDVDLSTPEKYAQVEAESLFADLEEAVAENLNEFETAETILNGYRAKYEAAFDSEDGKEHVVDDADDLRADLCYHPIDAVRNCLILPPLSSSSNASAKWPSFLDAYLLPPVQRKSVDTRRDAMSAELERFCMAHPCVIVRNICTALKLDMSLFSTKSIVDRDPQMQIEARVQLKQPMDSNLDVKTGRKSWFVSSRTTYMTLHSYGEYQAGLFVKALTDESTIASGGETGGGRKRNTGGAAAGGAKGRQKLKDTTAASTTEATGDAASVADDLDKASTASSSSHKPTAKQQPAIATTTAGGKKKQRRSSTATTAAPAAAAAAADDETSQTSTVDTTATTGGVAQQRPLKFEKILHCTNCDLSDMEKWSLQLAELQKLPRFLRVESATNMLTHLDHKVLGVNTPQLFMKVPGCRTTAHQQPLRFCAVNINIGPGECEWSCVPNEYCGRLRALCAANGVDFLHGSWWPDAEQLRAANIPVYRFTQLPGDLVGVNPGTIQWVYSTGWNNNITWNVAPFDARQLALSLQQYEENKMHNFKSLVPMMSLVWSLARNVSIREPLMYRMLKYGMRKCLIQSACINERLQRQYKFPQNKIIDQQREDGEPAYYCEACEVELFNYLLVKEDKTLGKFLPHCLQCAAAEDVTLGSYLAIQQYSQQQLSECISEEEDEV